MFYSFQDKKTLEHMITDGGNKRGENVRREKVRVCEANTLQT